MRSSAQTDPRAERPRQKNSPAESSEVMHSLAETQRRREKQIIQSRIPPRLCGSARELNLIGIAVIAFLVCALTTRSLRAQEAPPKPDAAAIKQTAPPVDMTAIVGGVVC